VELADVDITVHAIALVAYRPPEFDFRITVSPGTYVRAIARDLGDQLGVGSHLTRLRREAIGSLRVEDAVSLDRLSPAALIPPRRVLPDLPVMELDDAGRKDVAHGRAVRHSGAGAPGAGGKWGSGEAVALMGGGELIAVARAEDGWLRPTVVLESP
jgi:tRNA pseudouridine55 synthase